MIGRAVKRKKWVKYIGSQVRIFMGFFDYLFKQNRLKYLDIVILFYQTIDREKYLEKT